MGHTLTDEQIDGLEGRALDAAVAEHVMGWRLFESIGETWATKRRPGPNNSAFKVEVQDVGDTLMFNGRKFGFFEPGWSPSTDIGAAWQVVERVLKITAANVSIFSEPNSADGGATDVWNCNWLFDQRLFGDVSRCPTAPLAICRSALRAVRDA